LITQKVTVQNQFLSSFVLQSLHPNFVISKRAL